MRKIITVTLARTVAVFAAVLSLARFSLKTRYGGGLRAFLLFAVILPAAVFAQKVNIDFDRDADFTKYKTNAYQVCHRVENPLVDKRIVKELESRVAIEGLSRAESDPDVNVTYHSSTSEEFAIDTTTWGYGFGSGWYWDTADTTVAADTWAVPVPSARLPRFGNTRGEHWSWTFGTRERRNSSGAARRPTL